MHRKGVIAGGWFQKSLVPVFAAVYIFGKNFNRIKKQRNQRLIRVKSASSHPLSIKERG